MFRETCPNPPTFCFERISVQPATSRSAITLQARINDIIYRTGTTDEKYIVKVMKVSFKIF